MPVGRALRRAFGWQLLLLLLATALSVGPAVAKTASDPPRNVIVTAHPAHVADVERRVVALGGSVRLRLPIIDGLAVTLPASRLLDLAAHPAVVGVSPDRRMRALGVDPGLGYDPSDLASMSSITQIVGAQRAWEAGVTGRGVAVAVVDTGVAPVPGLPEAAIYNGADLSFDLQTGLPPYVDAYGHGTHMAAIIAGRDEAAGTSLPCTTCLNSSPYSDTTAFVGVAPGATIVNVKVGAYDGGCDVSQMIAAIDWVVEHKDDQNIRVLSLSYGTDGTQAPHKDPLANAVENAWRAGIFVSVAAGNDGVDAPGLANPARDPFVFAVGASDAKGTLDRNDDVVASYTNLGDKERAVEVVAPGRIISLRVPGSYLDKQYPSARIGERFFRGAGTSMAAAVASGVAALLYERFPSATPDQIKKLMLQTAFKPKTKDKIYRTYGIVDAGRAVAETTLSTWTQAYTPSDGSGLLEAARGSFHVKIDNRVLKDELDWFGLEFRTPEWATKSAERAVWVGGRWRDELLTGEAWEIRNYVTAKWQRPSWAGKSWDELAVTTASFNGRSWSGEWPGRSWSASSFPGRSWSAYLYG